MGSEIQLETGDDDVWNVLAKVIFPGDTSSITFDVKACHDARIGLESVTGSERYEIVICGHKIKEITLDVPMFHPTTRLMIVPIPVY